MLAVLQDSGLSSDQLSSLGTMLVDYVKTHADQGLVEKILAQVPALKAVLG